MRKENGKQVSGLGYIAIMSIIFVANVVNAPLGALELVAQQFPDVPNSVVQMLATVPNAIAMIFSIVSGILAGKKMKFRTVAVLASLLVVISGVIPAVISGSFAVLMISRVIFGVGFGLMVPMTNTLILLCYEGDKQARALGVSGIVYNIGATIFSLAGGYLALVDLRLIWLVQLVGMVTFFLCLFKLPEPKVSSEENETGQQKISLKGLPARVFIIGILVSLLLSALNYITTLNMSNIIVGEGIGNAGTASIAITITTVAGIVISAVFEPIYVKMGRFTYAFTGILQILSMLLCMIGKTAPVLFVSAFLGGAAYMLFYLVVFADFGQTLKIEYRSFASSFAMAMTQLSGFVTSLITVAIVAMTGNNDPRFSIMAATVLSVIILIITVVYVMLKKTTAAEEA